MEQKAVEKAATEHNLLDMLFAGGPIMYPLLIIAVAAIFFTINRFMVYGKDGNEAKGLPEEVSDLVRNNQADQALSRAESIDGPVAASMATILRNRGQAM